MQIFDSHQQLWNPDKFYYAWLTDVTPVRQHLPEDMPRAGEGWTLGGSMVIDGRALPEQGISEARWLNQATADHAHISGVIAYAPLENHNFHAYLEVIQRDAPHVRGVRRAVLGDDVRLMRREHFLDAVRVLPDYGMTFDLTVDAHGLSQAAEMVSHAPNVPIVIDHMGRPDTARGAFESWRYAMRSLAAFPSVHCKLSMPVIDGQVPPSLSVMRQYVESVVGLFGVERVMFGSNMPRLRLANVTYDDWVRTVLQVVELRGTDAVRRVFHDNARTFYGLDS